VSQQLRELLDRAELSDLIGRYGLMADRRTFGEARSCFTEDVVAEYPSGKAEGVETLAAFGEQALNAYERTQHVITNLLIDLDGDRARVGANLIAVHIPLASAPAVHFDTGCRYEFEAKRTLQGWRISRLRLEVLWTAGTDDDGIVTAAD
jgi:hypothetical protein